VANPSFPLLSLLLLLPLAGGILLFGLKNERQVCHFAMLVALLELLLTWLLLFHFQSASADMQFVERKEWIPTLNIQYLLGVDGISVVFLPLTALINLCVIAVSKTIHTLPRLYFALLLWLESATIGVFAALDLGLFFMFWELTLPPLYFLLSLWGAGPQRRHAAIKYTLFMLAGGGPLLLGCVLLALNNARETAMPAPAGLSFDYFTLLETPIPLPVQSTIFLLLLLGFAVKAPLFPFHVWLPAAAMQSPVGITALLTGLKLGLYGIVRFAVPLAPQATQYYSGMLACWGVVSALYGALLALQQTNLRRMLAYSCISQVGLAMIGIAAVNIQGIQGAVFQLFNFGIISAGIFLLSGFLHQRMGSTDATALGGAARSIPLLTSLFLGLGLAMIGVPGTNGFAALQLIVIGAFKARIGAGLATLMTAILGAAYFLKAFKGAFLGPMTRREVTEAVDLRPLELCIAATFVSLALGFGISPQAVLNYSQKPLQAWVARLETGNLPTLATAGGKPEPLTIK
jgi:NADH-quinone oxidoreductase subunit M